MVGMFQLSMERRGIARPKLKLLQGKDMGRVGRNEVIGFWKGEGNNEWWIYFYCI